MSPQRFGGPIVDTDERRAVVRRLTDALYDYLTLDVVEIERGMNAPAPALSVPVLPKDPDHFIKLSDQIEALETRLAEGRRSLEDLPGPIAEMFKLGVIGPLQDQLNSMREYRTRLQAEMEKADV